MLGARNRGRQGANVQCMSLLNISSWRIIDQSQTFDASKKALPLTLTFKVCGSMFAIVTIVGVVYTLHGLPSELCCFEHGSIDVKVPASRHSETCRLPPVPS